jgi:glutamate synthase (NADPH/NADH) small chain
MSSNEYLTRINLMGAGRPGHATPVRHGRRVAVIGGGNTAMDSVRTALRNGADKAYIVYRRSLDEMPARVEEIHHARQEGVEFMMLSNPVEYRGNERGEVTSMLVQKMQLGEPDASGRRSPEPIPGAIEEVPIDEVIVSVGVSPNPLVPDNIPGLEISRRGTIVTNDDLQSSIPTLYAGGDIVRGGATVILAMGDGRHAAAAMHRQLSAQQD